MIIECTDEFCHWPALREQTPVADALQHAAETGHPVKIDDGPITAYACGEALQAVMSIPSLAESLQDARSAIRDAGDSIDQAVSLLP